MIRNTQYAIRNTQHVSRFTFEVIDTGIGISHEDQAVIFGTFQQSEAGATEGGGTGLGLAIAQKQIELIGGQLEVESEPGKGSRFFFTVPLKPATSEIQTSEVYDCLADGCYVKVLIADDVGENRDVLAEMLSNIGCDVLLAENGRQAVEMVHTSQPDIIFMDIRMPVLNGLEAARQIWDQFGGEDERVKIVAISASTLAHERERYLSAGFDAFISKPFRAEKIYECLADLLEVEYEYAEVAAQDEAPLDLSKITLSEDLFSRLKRAAELYRQTEFEGYLGEVAELSSPGKQLAEHLYGLSQNNEMDRILEILSEIGHE